MIKDEFLSLDEAALLYDVEYIGPNTVSETESEVPPAPIKIKQERNLASRASTGTASKRKNAPSIQSAPDEGEASEVETALSNKGSRVRLCFLSVRLFFSHMLFKQHLESKTPSR